MGMCWWRCIGGDVMVEMYWCIGGDVFVGMYL